MCIAYYTLCNSLSNVLHYFLSRNLKKVKQKILQALTSNLGGRSSCWVSSRRQHTEWVVSHVFSEKQNYMAFICWFKSHSSLYTWHQHSNSSLFAHVTITHSTATYWHIYINYTKLTFCNEPIKCNQI